MRCSHSTLATFHRHQKIVHSARATPGAWFSWPDWPSAWVWATFATGTRWSASPCHSSFPNRSIWDCQPTPATKNRPPWRNSIAIFLVPSSSKKHGALQTGFTGFYARIVRLPDGALVASARTCHRVQRVDCGCQVPRRLSSGCRWSRCWFNRLPQLLAAGYDGNQRRQLLTSVAQFWRSFKRFVAPRYVGGWKGFVFIFSF